ncbi:MAG: hypothetical protein MJ238_05425, partial [Bacilli bacterium]|nr:hypothetical protein [Bacilli bacterium]
MKNKGFAGLLLLSSAILCACGGAPTHVHTYSLAIEGEYETSYKSGDNFSTEGLIVKKVCSGCEEVVEVSDYYVEDGENLLSNAES